MKKTDENLALCVVIFVTSLVISNITAPKLILTGIPLFGGEAVVPCAVFCYAATFLMTDVIGEIWGKRAANDAVKMGFIGQIFAAALLFAAERLPAADAEVQSAYVRLLGQNWVFVAASLAAYLVSQYWDVTVFHAIRDRMLSRDSGRGARWVWNNASTMTSQLIDTVLFIGIAFGLGLGWLFDDAMRPTLWAMMAGQYVVKFALAALDTPIFMLLTRDRQYLARADI